MSTAPSFPLFGFCATMFSSLLSSFWTPSLASLALFSLYIGSPSQGDSAFFFLTLNALSHFNHHRTPSKTCSLKTPQVPKLCTKFQAHLLTYSAWLVRVTANLNSTCLHENHWASPYSLLPTFSLLAKSTGPSETWKFQSPTTRVITLLSCQLDYIGNELKPK